MRLACLYALLDTSDIVRTVHLDAALAVWKYADASVHYIFGDALGRPLADRLLGILRGRPRGLTRTDIRNVLNRHGKRSEIDAALKFLEKLGLARMESTETDGRPAEVWHAIVAAPGPRGSN